MTSAYYSKLAGLAVSESHDLLGVEFEFLGLPFSSLHVKKHAWIFLICIFLTGKFTLAFWELSKNRITRFKKYIIFFSCIHEFVYCHFNCPSGNVNSRSRTDDNIQSGSRVTYNPVTISTIWNTTSGHLANSNWIYLESQGPSLSHHTGNIYRPL